MVAVAKTGILCHIERVMDQHKLPPKVSVIAMTRFSNSCGPNVLCTGCLLAVLAAATLWPPALALAARKGPPDRTVTLAECILLALRENRDIKSAYIDRVTQKFDLKVAEDKFLPDIDLNGAAGYRRSDTRNRLQSGDFATRESVRTRDGEASVVLSETIPTGGQFGLTWSGALIHSRDGDGARLTDSETETWEATFSQPLLRDGGIAVNTASVDTARINEEINRQALKSTLMNTVSRVIAAYRSLLLADREVEISRASLKRARTLLTINRLLIETGRMAAVEIIQTEADIARQEFNLQTVINGRDNARLNLLEILDIDNTTRITPLPEEVADHEPPSAGECLEIAVDNRPDFRQALLNRRLADIDLLLAKNGSLWDLALTSTYSLSNTKERSTPADSRTRDWTVGLSLTIPLYGDLTREQALVRAKGAAEKSELTIQELRDNIEIEIQDKLRDIASRLKQLDLARQSTRLSEKKLAIEEEKLKAGRSTNFQLVSFQNDLATAQNAEANAVIDYLNALSDLDLILGTTLTTWNIEMQKGQQQP
jgi:outer membrane protein